MAGSSYVDLVQKLEEACEFLRFFTLGRPGYTQRDGLAGIQRVSELCDRLKADVDSGPHIAEATAATASGRCRIKAAQARLDLLHARGV